MSNIHKKLGITIAALGSLHGAAHAQEPRGATVPFTTYEAETPTNRVKGTTVVMSGLPAKETSSPEMEASGRAYSQLSATGDYIEFPGARAANTIVIRHCIPDAPTGGGLTATLSLYVNGTFRQKLTLSSKHNWLYGAGENGQKQDPAAGPAHVFWDEARFFITGGLRQGDTLRLQKDIGDDAAFYRVDLIDLELAPAPLAPPAAGTYLSVNDFGANGSDTQDDAKAIQSCIDAAKAGGKIVWMPPGTYYQSAKFLLDGVEVRGAGMWYTQLISTGVATERSGNIGFMMKGDGPKVSDLFIDDVNFTARAPGSKPFVGDPTNWRIENVWITHSNTGIWIKGSNGVVRGCRIRLTYADGINLNQGASNNIVEQNHIRGIGDDGIALLSELELKDPASSNNIIRFNTVSAVWWGHNCDLAGGSGNIIEDNIFVDNSKMGVFTLNLPVPFPMHPITGAIIRRNSMIRGGGNAFGQKRGAIWIYPGSTTISNVLFQDNLIVAPIFRGIHLAGTKSQEVIFERNIIENPGEDGIVINPGVTGSVLFESNTVRQLRPGGRALVNNAGADFKVKQIANTFAPTVEVKKVGGANADTARLATLAKLALHPADTPAPKSGQD